MSGRHAKYLIFVSILVAVALSGYFSLSALRSFREETVYRHQIAQIKKASGIDKVPTLHGKLDTLRSFIHAQSQHNENAEFFSVWRERTKLAQNFIDGLEGRRQTPPPMECSTRSALMRAVLDAENLRTRSIDAYRVSAQGNLAGHALFDVFNPETGRWETQDPEYDIHWQSQKTGERASMVDAVADMNIIPCQGEKCGWTLKNREQIESSKLRDHLAFVTTIDRAADERITFYRQGGNDKQLTYNNKVGTYCELIEKNCADGFMPATADNLLRVQD